MDLYTAFLNLVVFILGLCFGSFLNVIVYRLPHKISLANPPSACPACHSRLGAMELIPLIGYLILRGRCRHCNVRISPRYPLVELATGLLFLMIFSRFSFTIDAYLYLTLLYLLFAVTLIDLEHRIVPNTLVAAGLAVGVLFYIPAAAALLFNLPAWLIVDRPVTDALLGFAVGGGIMLIIFLVSRGGMGAGDLKLMALIGFYVGLQGTALVLLLGFIFGAVVGLTFMALGRLTRKDALPFAPYLAAATFIEVFWGEQIWSWYINLLR
jgi:leader peptidase (prepilin peptidase) / N-methyltransferase